MSRAATPADVIAGAARWCVVEGDALDVVRALPVACLDAVVTDPPSGIAFMNAEWDRDKGGRAQWVAWLAEVLGHARAATRDGGRALVWSLPRTSHWTGCAVEDAGWSIESTVTHLFGTGWPKGKSQLKPAAETWWLARTGRSTALNIDGCRVGTSKSVPASANSGSWHGRMGPSAPGQDGHNPNIGRYPPNVVFSHAPECRCIGERRVECNNRPRNNSYAVANTYGSGNARVVPVNFGDPDGTELVEAWECVEHGCPVRELDAQSGELVSNAVTRPVERGLGYGGGGGSVSQPREEDRGGASRFFPQFPADEAALFGYHAKPSRAERNAGVEGDGNIHSTVKSIALMRWLVRLVTRPGDVVLDPFAGTGTTGVAALIEGQRVILVEKEPRYAEIARQRCEQYTLDLSRPVRAPARPKARRESEAQPSLFGGSKVPGDG